jgi:hypothetical protein
MLNNHQTHEDIRALVAEIAERLRPGKPAPRATPSRPSWSTVAAE